MTPMVRRGLRDGVGDAGVRGRADGKEGKTEREGRVILSNGWRDVAVCFGRANGTREGRLEQEVGAFGCCGGGVLR